MKLKLGKNKIIVLITLLIAIGLIITAIIMLLLQPDKEKKKLNNNDTTETKKQKTEEKKVKIVDLNSNSRVYAVMINNNHNAWPQSGLKNAFLIYEMMVEGGITRMMALYTQDVNETKIGSIRSSRHYYLDYLLENDAIYVHWGGSKLAYSDLKKINIDRIDGMAYGNKYFVTDSSLNRALEHTRFSSSSLIKNAIKDLKIRSTTNNNYLLNYVTDEIDLSKTADNMVANDVTITYSNYQTSSYKYDSNTKTYLRSMNNIQHKDLVTNEQYSFKNIIVYAIDYKTLSDGNLQDLENIGTGNGYYITNGYAIPITWTKSKRNEKTVYKYKDGKEINVSDGNTFIQIFPKTGNVSIK